MRPLLILAFAISACQANGQSFSLDEILNARVMDSTELISFSHLKGFELKEIEISASSSIHKYCLADSAAWFERNFPKQKVSFPGDTTSIDARTISYHFRDKEALKAFKKDMKEKGFKFERTVTNTYKANAFTHNQYGTKDRQIDLVSEKIQGQELRFTLTHNRRIKFPRR